MTNEQWKPARGFEGLYDVSSLGRVRRSNNAPITNSSYRGRIIGSYDKGTGYNRVTLNSGGKKYRVQVHVLVARTFLEEARPFAHVNHKDGNKTNNAVENLEWCTPQQNVRHAWRIGLCRPLLGEQSGASKLKERDVHVIRDARKRGVLISHVAAVFNVTEATISAIDRMQTWSHLEEKNA